MKQIYVLVVTILLAATSVEASPQNQVSDDGEVSRSAVEQFSKLVGYGMQAAFGRSFS